MNKFVKISYTPTETVPPVDPAPIATGAADKVSQSFIAGLKQKGGKFLVDNADKINWVVVLPALLNTGKMFSSAFVNKNPRWGAGFGENILAVIQDFFTSLSDDSFQTVAATALLEYLQLGVSKEQTFSPEAYQYYYRKTDSLGQPLARGGYQKTMGKVPDKNQIPIEAPTYVVDKVQAIGNEKITRNEKIKKLRELIKYYSTKTESIAQATGL